MDTFNWLPSFQPALTRAPRLLTANYGDGYEQRAADGINNAPRTWDLTFSNRDETEANAIDTFLVTQGGIAAFNWTDPNGNDGEWICKSWKVTRTNPLNYEVTATFKEVFDP